MKIKRFSLTAFFILLTLSIGLVSVNSPLAVKAQNSALSQSGDDSKAVQRIGQSQSSEQNGQVVSSESSILSGNNLLCENQSNSKEVQKLTGICDMDETTSPPPPTSPPPNANFLIDIRNADCEVFGSGTKVLLRCTGNITTTLPAPLNVPDALDCIDTNVELLNCTIYTGILKPLIPVTCKPPLTNRILECTTT